MTGVRLHHSNRLEVLAAELARLVRTVPGDPVAPERIVVPHPTIGRWLSITLAGELGIAANVRYEQPAEFAWSVMRGVVAELSRDRPYEPARLRWRIHDLLPGPPVGATDTDRDAHVPEGAVRGYLRDGDPRKRLELADRLARMYDQCLLYRPDWILDWENGSTPHWQARLWRQVVGTDGAHGGDHWVGALRKFRRKLHDSPPASAARDGSDAGARASPAHDSSSAAFPRAESHPPSSPVGNASCPHRWPRRASFFAVPALSPSYLELLREAATRMEIHLFVLNPCREYWGDIHTRREIDHRAAGEDPDAGYFTEGNELLAALGRTGRDMIDALLEVPDATSEERFEVPAGADRLAAVQRDILDLQLSDEAARDDESPAAGPVATRPPQTDESIQVHVCHSPVREAEVLHDCLLAVFDAQPDLEPADVLVLTPDLETYGPAIEAVFAAAGRIPCNVARARTEASHTLRAYLALLSLPASRYGAETVLAPLAAPAIGVRFGIGDADVGTIRDWVREAGIRWGVDEAHRGEEDLPETADHTWRRGLRRLLLGYAMADASHPVAGLVPCRGVRRGFDFGEMDGELLGRFVSYCDKAFGLRDRLGGRRPPAGWGEVLRDVVCDFLADGLERARGGSGPAGRTLARDLAEEVAAVRSLIREFENEASQARTPVPIEVVLEVLRERAGQTVREVARLADGVTVASLGAGRIVPAGVVCLAGMNDGVFPRSPSTPSFDVVAAGRARRGDRDMRREDRFAFLEALLAARRCFLVTHIGRGLRDDAPIPPSVLVGELKDYLARRFPGETFESRHPLQPFSPRYFEADGEVQGTEDRATTTHADAADRDRAPPDSSDVRGNAPAGRTGAGKRLFSYSRGMCEAAKAVRAGTPASEGRSRFVGVTLPEPDASRRSVDLADLVAFFANPARCFLRDRLGMRLELDDLALDDEEPFGLDNLELHRLRSDIWDQIQAGIRPEHGAALLHGSGRLPQVGLGRIIHESAREAVEPLEGLLAPYRKALDAPPRPVDFELRGFRIVGAVEHVDPDAGVAVGADAGEVEPDRMVWWRVGALRAQDRIGIWLRQLAWAAAGHGPLEAVVVSRERGSWRSAAFPPPGDAGEQLGRWIDTWRKGLAVPLRLYPETSYAFAKAIASVADVGDAIPEAILEAARDKAYRAWLGNRFQPGPGEGAELHVALVHDADDPLTGDFEELAATLLVPLARAQP